ncbi:alpha/beta hydrolase [Fulvivirga sp. 29W222]|uniref:Alpha/beta hydrolase n=1 Tax=Fulvivirga marina TaxID=2494733 RepID=A0A937FW81_9BACT|nr:alpha/beta hydrolase [Fulvivirga marina]MBL6446158.1 alpha/beta hydrolase [Fulvivirga marina]
MAISFSEKGSGFPVVLIHGFCETRDIWGAFLDTLSAHYRVITPDLPGFGGSALPAGDFSIDNVADIIYEWLQELGAKKVIMIGHSLGGYITLAYAKKYSDTLRGIGLFHSTAFADSNEKKSSRNRTIDFVRERGVEVFAHSFVPQLFYLKNRTALKPEIEGVVNTAAQTPEASLIGYTKAMRDRNDRTDVLQSLNVPVLIVAGDKDTSVPIEAIYEQELMPKKAIVHIFDNVGHMGMFEKKQQSLKAIQDFAAYCI